jgi:cytochrome P450
VTAQQPASGSVETPPTPDGVPFFGNGLAFSRDPVGAMEDWASLGDVVRLKLPGQSMYMVTHPALIERVLAADHEQFTISAAQRETFRGVEDHAVTTTTGNRWERLRTALRPAFTHEALDRYGDRMAATTAAFVDEWGDGERIDVYQEMRLLAVNVLADTLLETDVRGNEAVVTNAADALVDRVNFRRPGQLLPDWLPTLAERRFDRTVRSLDEFVDEILTRRRRSGSGTDVCSVLLDAHERGELTLPEVRHNLVALLLAGHDSPSVALTYVWYALADRPEVCASLRDEYDAVVDGDRPSSGAYDELERTRNVVAETLRMYPPTLGVSRQTAEPVTLGRYELPEGAQLLLPQRVVHRDDRFWDDPETFDPSRWQRKTNRPEYAYFPFSGGPRNCVGTHFARQELTLALATMIGRVELDVSIDGPLEFTPSIQLRPETDITATVTRR